MWDVFFGWNKWLTEKAKSNKKLFIWYTMRKMCVCFGKWYRKMFLLLTASGFHFFWSLIYHFILMGLVNFNLLCKTKWTHSKPSAQSSLFYTLMTTYICYYYLFINALFRCSNFHNVFFSHSNTHHIVGSVFHQFFFKTYLHKIIYFTYWIHI